MQELKPLLCSAPCLAYPDLNKDFYLEAGFSQHCMSAGLYQIHDRDKRAVAHANTVWAVKHFSNYVEGQKVIIETCHQPVTFLHSQRIHERGD